MESIPGLSIEFTPQPGESSAPVAVANQDQRQVDLDRDDSVVHHDRHICVRIERSSWYPFEWKKTARVFIGLEGRVYAPQWRSVFRSLEELPTEHLDDAGAGIRIRACTRDIDGDFLLLWHDLQENQVVVVGDFMGRLPVYYHASDNRILVSRSQAVLLDSMNRREIDPTGVGQLLLLGYPLRARTMIDGVSRLLPGEALVASPTGWRLLPQEGSPFRKSTALRIPPTPHSCARMLRDAFVSACSDRHIIGQSQVLSLSGGMDSRTTGAGMRAAFGSFSSVTFFAPGSVHSDERPWAGEVARVLGADWQTCRLNHANQRCIDDIIRLKLGLSPIDVAFGLDYVKLVQAMQSNPVVFWTGEGADKLLCEHRAIPRRPRIDELVRFIVEKNAVWSPRDAAALVGMTETDLLAGIYAAVSAHHDVDPADAYVHFLLSERVVRWHCEGEDRHRVAVWPVSPFFGRDFFELARATPSNWKFGRRMYRAFLQALAPDIAALPLTGDRSAPGSRRFVLEHTIREHVRNDRRSSNAYMRLRRLRASRLAHGSPWWTQVKQLAESGGLPPVLDAGTLSHVLADGSRASPHALSVLLTVMLAIREVQGREHGGPMNSEMS